MGIDHAQTFADDLQDSFQWESADVSKIIGGYVAGYAKYQPRLGEVFIQVFVDPRKRTEQRYTFSINDISAPVMRLDWSVHQDRLYTEPGYNARWVLEKMEEYIASDLDHFQKYGYGERYV
jgi:hypothetical protein